MKKLEDNELVDQIPPPPADYLENDLRYKDLIQDSSRDYLRTHDSDFLRREGYSWDDKNNLLDKDGKVDSIPSTLIGSAGWGQVEKKAHDEFSERHGNDLGIYKQREKVRVYEDPKDDPAYKEVEKQITIRSNLSSQQNPQLWPNLSRDDYERLAIRNRALATEAFWGKFASEYPEKTAAYSSGNEFLSKVVFQKEEQKRKWAERDLEKKEIRKQEDESRKQEVLQSLGVKSVEADSIPDVRKFHDAEFITNGEEKIYRDAWDDPEVKVVEKLIASEINHRINSSDGVHENLADDYAKLAEDVRRGKWAAFVEQYPTKSEAYREWNKGIRDILEPKTEAVPINIDSRAVEKPKINKESLSTEDIVTEYLAYQDIPASADEKKAMLEYSLKPESPGMKYAESLQEILEVSPKEQIEGVASHMVTEAKGILNKYGIRGSNYLKSKTWAMWDIGKQYHYFTHPDETDKKYSIANPLKSHEKIQEMIDRQVGWEVYRMKKENFADKFKKHPLYARLQELLRRVPKNSNGSLSSKDLAELGSVIRKIVEEK